MICRHCHRGRVTRPRGLCWSCYYRPGVREKYTSLSNFGNRGVGNVHHDAPLPAFPTQASPGTPEKIAILQERASLQQSLFHPEDATLEEAGPAVLQAG